MTRPKADSDPWLTDPISRDRVIAKTVVEGMRTMIGLLRSIRDELGETRALRHEIRELREEVSDLWRAQHAVTPIPARKQQWPACEKEFCALPMGHPGSHRGSLRAG